MSCELSIDKAYVVETYSVLIIWVSSNKQSTNSQSS